MANGKKTVKSVGESVRKAAQAGKGMVEAVKLPKKGGKRV